MAEEPDNTVSFIAEQFKRLNLRLDGIETRLDRIEDRLGQVEKRLSASAHLEQGLLGHLASLHDSMDAFKADMLMVDRRLSAPEARG